MNDTAHRPLFVSLSLASPVIRGGVNLQAALERYFVTTAAHLQVLRCWQFSDTSMVIDLLVDQPVFCRRLFLSSGPLLITLAPGVVESFCVGMSHNGEVLYYTDVKQLPYWSHLSFDLLQSAMEGAKELLSK